MAAALIGTLLVLLPVGVNFSRYAALGIFMLLHGIAVGLGQSPLVALLGLSLWSAFLPRSFRQGWETAIESEERRGLTIYYDADCGFCKKVVHVLRALLVLPGTPLVTAQSDDSICADMEAQNSWVVVDWTQKRRFKFGAIAYICSLSPVFFWLAPLLKLPPVMAVGNRFYETIANNRRKAGLLTRFLTLTSRPVETTRGGDIAVVVGLVGYLVLRLYRLV